MWKLLKNLTKTPLLPQQWIHQTKPQTGAAGGTKGADKPKIGVNGASTDTEWTPGTKRKNRRLNSQTSSWEPHQKRQSGPAADRADRKYAVEITNAALSSAGTRTEFAQTLARILLDNVTVRKSLKTADGRILSYDYNVLLLADRWKSLEGPVTAKVAERGGSSCAVVVHNVEPYISTEIIVEKLKRSKIGVTSANQLKRSSD